MARKLTTEERIMKENEVIGASMFFAGQILEVEKIDFDEEADDKFKQPLTLFFKGGKRYPIKAWFRPKIDNNNKPVEVLGTFTREILDLAGHKQKDFIQLGETAKGKKVKTLFNYFHTVGEYGVYTTYTIGFDYAEE